MIFLRISLGIPLRRKGLGHQGSLAERSKALASGASPKGREFESHSCHFWHAPLLAEADRHQTRTALPRRARLAQLVERKALNLVVVGSSPTVGERTFRETSSCCQDSSVRTLASAVWSRGMILRLGRRGPGFESLNGPFFVLRRRPARIVAEDVAVNPTAPAD